MKKSKAKLFLKPPFKTLLKTFIVFIILILCLSIIITISRQKHPDDYLLNPLQSHNLKNYSDENISFSYPSDWEVNNTPYAQREDFDNTRWKIWLRQKDFQEKWYPQITIKYDRDKTDVSCNHDPAWSGNNHCTVKNLKISKYFPKIVIRSYKFYSDTDSFDRSEELYQSTTFIPLKNAYQIELDYFVSKKSAEEYKPVYDLVLSSLKI